MADPALDPIPPRLSADPRSVWYHPHWSKNTKALLDGHAASMIIEADTVEGWAIGHINPLRLVGDRIAAYRFRGRVEFQAMNA